MGNDTGEISRGQVIFPHRHHLSLHPCLEPMGLLIFKYHKTQSMCVRSPPPHPSTLWRTFERWNFIEIFKRLIALSSVFLCSLSKSSYFL